MTRNKSRHQQDSAVQSRRATQIVSNSTQKLTLNLAHGCSCCRGIRESRLHEHMSAARSYLSRCAQDHLQKNTRQTIPCPVSRIDDWAAIWAGEARDPRCPTTFVENKSSINRSANANAKRSTRSECPARVPSLCPPAVEPETRRLCTRNASAQSVQQFSASSRWSRCNPCRCF